MDSPVLANMEQMLQQRARHWYPGRNVVFRCTSEYVEFDDMLNREVSCADFAVEELRIHCSFQVSDRMFQLEITTDRATGRPPLLHTLTATGLCEINGSVAGRAILKIGGALTDVDVYIEDGELRSATGYDTGICAMLCANPSTMEQWLQSSVRRWFGETVHRIEVESHHDSNGHKVSLEAFLPVSSVEVDMSVGSQADVLRWRETSFDHQCVSHVDLDRDDALRVLQENGIELPPNADFTGWYRNEYGGTTEAFILRCEHRIPDTSPEYLDDLTAHPSGFPEIYQYPGLVTVEGDFFQCMVDTTNRRVFALHQKWQDV